MKHLKNMTEAEVQELTAEIGDALSRGAYPTKIAKVLDCSIDYVRKIEAGGCFPARERRAKRVGEIGTEEYLESVVAFYEDHTIKQTAEQFSLDHRAVSKIVRESGTIRKPGPKSPSAAVLMSLGLKVVTVKLSEFLRAHYLEHTTTSRRLQIHKQDMKKIRADAVGWLKGHADEINQAFKD